MEKSIKEMGWNELVMGAALFSFNDQIEYNVAEVLPEDRNYAETNSKMAYVGDWRVVKPVWNTDLCIHCQNCWLYCPDTSIISRSQKMQGVDYDHCKGCGVCVEVCPTNPKSLLMFDENMKNEAALASWPQKDPKAKAKGDSDE